MITCYIPDIVLYTFFVHLMVGPLKPHCSKESINVKIWGMTFRGAMKVTQLMLRKDLLCTRLCPKRLKHKNVTFIELEGHRLKYK